MSGMLPAPITEPIIRLACLKEAAYDVERLGQEEIGPILFHEECSFLLIDELGNSRSGQYRILLCLKG